MRTVQGRRNGEREERGESSPEWLPGPVGSGLVLPQTCCVSLGWWSSLSVFSSCSKLRALLVTHSVNAVIVLFPQAKGCAGRQGGSGGDHCPGWSPLL